MITKIDSKNYGLYKALFEDASSVLGFTIPDLDAYMANINTLRREHETSIDHHFTALPLDEPPFVIDANSRQIEIPATFKKNGLAVVGDHMAEMVYFSIDRYYDTWDLLKEDMQAVVQWTFVSGGKPEFAGISPITEIDAIIYEKDRKLLLGWPIDNKITPKAGTIKFSVRFFKVVSIDNVDHLVFNMNTIPITIEIKNGLDFINTNGEFKEEVTNISNIFERRFDDSFGYVNGDGADEPWWIIPLSLCELDEEEGPELQAITFEAADGSDEDHPLGYFISDLDEEDKLTIAITAGGNGDVKCYIHDGSAEAPEMSKYYFKTSDETNSGEKVYYTHSVVDSNDVYTTATVPLNTDPYYYECIYIHNIEGTGTYNVEAINKVQPAWAKGRFTGDIIVPAPLIPTLEVDNHIQLDPTTGLFTIAATGSTTQVINGVKDKINYTVSDDSDFMETELGLESGTTKEFEINANELLEEEQPLNMFSKFFTVNISASRNGTNSEPVSDVVRVTYPAEKPTVTITYDNENLTVPTVLTANVTNAENILHDEDSFTYQWCKVTAAVDDLEDIEGATESTYTATTSGRYYCIVTNTVNESVAEGTSLPVAVTQE